MSNKARKAASAARLAKDKMSCNKPQRAPKGDKHKYVVKACQGGQEKIVRFGLRGYEDYLQHQDEGRRANFKARHNCSEKKDKLTPGWWACNYNWGILLVVGLSEIASSLPWNLLNTGVGIMS